MSERDGVSFDEPNVDKWLEKTNATDLTRTGLIAATEIAMQTTGLPFGPAVAAVLAKIIPERKHQRLVMFVEDLGHRMERVESKVDHDFVRTAEFEALFERAFDRVQTRENDEKISYWAALIAGLAQADRPPRSDRDRLIETLDRLRLSHLRLLHVIATSGEPKDDSGLTTSASDTLRWKMPDVDVEDARRDWKDLEREDLVGAFPSGMMTPRGAANLAGHLRPYGQQVIRLLRLESEPPEVPSSP